MTPAIKVLVIDDSALVRRSMTEVLEPEGFAVATAADPVIARRKIATARPDVILLDLEMPREDGLTFLRELMARDPIPVVICSAHSTEGSRAALDALREGAVDVVAKPRVAVREFVQESATLLADAIRGATRARLRPPRIEAPRATPRPAADAGPTSQRVIAIAASTGGPEALHELLAALPAQSPGLVIMQHMPAGFTAAFARYLDEHCIIRVREAVDGDVVQDGLALIAPGGRHLVLHRRHGGYAVGVADGPLVSRHRPSADVLFTSVAATAGADAVGVIMTGMGADGAAGLLAMRDAGALTLAQNEATCVVYGMPREAVARGAVDAVLPLAGLAGAIARAARGERPNVRPGPPPP